MNNNLAEGADIRIFGLDDGVFTPLAIPMFAPEVTYKQHAHRSGYFIIKYPLDDPDAKYFQKHRLVVIDGRFSGIIRDIYRSRGHLRHELTVTGVDLAGLLEQRYAVPAFGGGEEAFIGYENITGSTEYIVKTLWERNIGGAADILRRLPFLHIAANQNRGIQDDAYSVRMNRLSEATAELIENGGLLVNAYIDVDEIENDIFRFIFDVREPRDRTATLEDTDAKESEIVLSTERNTVFTIDYADELSNSGNVFYATRSSGKTEDELQTLLRIRDGETEPSGIQRFERQLSVSVSVPQEMSSSLSDMEKRRDYLQNRILDVKIDNEERSAMYSELSGLYPQISALKREIELYILEEMRIQARHGMLSFEPRKWLDAKVNFTNLERYRDYDLGDYITVEDAEWGIVENVQVMEIETQYINNSKTVSVVLGKRKEYLPRQIMRDIANSN